jgi:hypothetical protein
MAGKQSLPPGASVSLTVMQGLPGRSRFALDHFPVLIGSRPEAEVPLQLPQVAPSQARLMWVGESLHLEDLARAGTTRVNDQVADRIRLRNGDIIEIGPVKLLVQLSLPVARPAEEPAEERLTKTAWAVGFSEEFRQWWRGELSEELDLKLQSFRTGEEVLVALSRALGSQQSPALIILDLRLPMINGINLAIAARSLALGFRRQNLIPMVFLFDPPDATSSFDKVVKFCQPLRVFSPQGSDLETREIARDLAAEIGVTLLT